MRGDKAFVDTNVLAYLFSEDEPLKRERSIRVFNEYDCYISTQVLNEFCNICTRKWKLPANDILRAIEKICRCGGLCVVNSETVKEAVILHDKYGYAYYDCLIISSALERDCKYLLTEDLADGQVIENRLIVLNIFRE
jgi:predicted nucleic acid-binding protein